MKSFFSKLEVKDVLTFSLSMLALSLSILSTYISTRQKKFETQRTLRIQLTDVLGKIAALNLELAKIPVTGASASGLTTGMKGHLIDQKRFLVRQATYISDQIPQLVSPFEYLLIAGTFADIQDVYRAEQFFRKAIEHVGQDDLDLGIITRGFARFLFTYGEPDLAREQYSAAVGIFSGDSDIMKDYRGDTYLRWGIQEHEWAYIENSGPLFDQAKAVFDSIANPLVRQRNLAQLDSRIAQTYGRSKPTPEENANAPQP
jgi:hypothetical protein